MSATEWSAVGLITLFLIFILRRHGASIDYNRDSIRAVDKKVTRVENAQARCMADLNSRFKRGEDYFEDLGQRVSELKKENLTFSASVVQLQTLTKGLAESVGKLDDRMWQDRGGEHG